jgi:hypothetical protein
LLPTRISPEGFNDHLFNFLFRDYCNDGALVIFFLVMGLLYFVPNQTFTGWIPAGTPLASEVPGAATTLPSTRDHKSIFQFPFLSRIARAWAQPFQAGT